MELQNICDFFVKKKRSAELGIQNTKFSMTESSVDQIFQNLKDYLKAEKLQFYLTKAVFL